MIALYIDADACPVKDEVYRVAGRYGLQVHVVSNSWIRTPADPKITLVGCGRPRLAGLIAAEARVRATRPTCGSAG